MTAHVPTRGDDRSPDEAARETAREARDHPALDWTARVGMLAYGVVYLLVGWLAAHLALGDRAGSVSGEGALHEVAQQPLGAVALWLACGGLAALVVWEACQAVGGHRDHDGVRRLAAAAASAGRAVVFGVLAVLSAKTALGDGGGGSTDSMTAQVMQAPLGQALVVAVGLGIGAVGVVSAAKVITGRWRKELEAEGRTGASGTLVGVVARVGYLSRAAAFLLIAGLFVWAGVSHDAQKSGGLDQALLAVRDHEAGPSLILVVAAGLACFGVYNVVRAWYLRGS